MSVEAPNQVKPGESFFLFPGHSMARATVEVVTSTPDGAPAVATLSLKGIDPDDVYHLKRLRTPGLDGQVLFHAPIDYVRDVKARNLQTDWE